MYRHNFCLFRFSILFLYSSIIGFGFVRSHTVRDCPRSAAAEGGDGVFECVLHDFILFLSRPQQGGLAAVVGVKNVLKVRKQEQQQPSSLRQYPCVVTAYVFNYHDFLVRNHWFMTELLTTQSSVV